MFLISLRFEDQSERAPKNLIALEHLSTSLLLLCFATSSWTSWRHLSRSWILLADAYFPKMKMKKGVDVVFNCEEPTYQSIDSKEQKENLDTLV